MKRKRKRKRKKSQFKKERVEHALAVDGSHVSSVHLKEPKGDGLDKV